MDILFRDSAKLNPLNVLDSGHSCALRFHIWSETSFLFFKLDLDVIQRSEFFDAGERRHLRSATPTETCFKTFHQTGSAPIVSSVSIRQHPDWRAI